MATDVQAPVPTGAPAAELCAPKTASEPAPALTIPVIDISGYLAGTPGAAVQTAAALRAAATAPGFFQIVGHPVSADLRHRLLAALTEFFALPDETKQALHRRNSPCLRGYEGLSEQELEPGVRDQKEGFMIGREPRVAALDEAPPPLRFAQGPNQWPDEAACPGFRDVMTEYFDAMRQLTIVMFRLMALGLGLEEHYFDVFADSPDCAFSLFFIYFLFFLLLSWTATPQTLTNYIAVTMCRAHRYPPTPPEAAEKNKGIGAHTDFGALTLLLQDDSMCTLRL